jgi:hypothetical protein
MQRRFLNKTGLYRFLSTLEASAEDFITVYAEPADFPEYVDRLSPGPKYSAYADEIREVVRIEDVVDSIRKYETGVAIFWSEAGNKHVVLPPFPITENKVSVGKIDVSILFATLEKRYSLGVVLVTWGSYAIGIFDGGNLVDWKTGTGFIHKKHRKGGRSEKRFARRTEEQKKGFLRRISHRIEERFGGFVPDHIFFGGNRLIAKPLIQECRYLRTKSDKISPRNLDVRHADREALVNSLAEITKSLVLTF